MARALDEEASDYLVKPFSPLELAARIRLALRRREMPAPSAPYVLGDLTIDYAERRVSLAGRAIEMTDIEYRTLAELACNAGRVLTYEHLLRRVWRLEGDTDLRSMRPVIRRLRRKLGENAEQEWDTLGPERSWVGWRSRKLPEGPVVLSSPFDRSGLYLLSAPQDLQPPSPENV